MAERNFDFCETLGRKKRYLACSFRPNGTGAVLDAKFPGGTVARTNTGEFTLTLADKYAAPLDLHASIVGASALAIQADVAAYDPVASTVVVKIHTAGTAADENAASNRYVTVGMLFDDSLSN